MPFRYLPYYQRAFLPYMSLIIYYYTLLWINPALSVKYLNTALCEMAHYYPQYRSVTLRSCCLDSFHNEERKKVIVVHEGNN